MSAPDPLLLGTAPKVEAPAVPRKPWVAFVLALVCDGLGHFYCGRVGAAVAWAALPVVTTLGLLSLGVVRPTWLPAIGALTIVVQLGLRLAQALLAARVARGLKAHRPTRINAVPMYFAFFLLVWGGGNALGRANRALVIEPFKIPSAAMAPSLLAGDQVFVLKVVPHSVVQRGDVVVYRRPNDDRAYVHRVVALGGETVALDDHTLRVGGSDVPARPCDDPKRTISDLGRSVVLPCWREANRDVSFERGSPRGQFAEQTVPAGHCFVLGDWRDNSEDSRHHGPVPVEDVVGRAAIVWLSWSDDWSIRWNRIGLQP